MKERHEVGKGRRMTKLDPAWEWLGRSMLGGLLDLPEEVFKKEVKECLFAEVRGLLKATGQTTPPYNPERIAKLRKIKQILKARLHHSGLLLPVENGFVMKLNNAVPIVRQRFACAHEIGHTFFFNLDTNPPSRPYSKLSSNYWVEEGLCNEIAREILLPEPSIREFVARHPYSSITAFKRMTNLFQVSSEVLVRQIQQLNLWKAIIIMFTTSSSSTDKDPIIRINKVFKSKCYRNKLRTARPGTMIDRGSNLYSNLYSAYNNGEEVITEEEISLGQLRGKHLIGSLRINSVPPKIVSVIPLEI